MAYQYVCDNKNNGLSLTDDRDAVSVHSDVGMEVTQLSFSHLHSWHGEASPCGHVYLL
jgi:hypothetical protein